MEDSWATSGLDVVLELAGTRRRAGLESALREAVESGRLPSGTRLPSSRTLAVELGLARNTVADAYGQLVAEGWLTARQGAGTRVGDRALPLTPAVHTPRPAAGRATYDLTPGSPDLGGFPRDAWLAANRRALTRAPNGGLGYPDPRGLPELRETLAQYLARVRGVRTTADQVIVCSGFTQALSLIASVVRRRGGRVMAVESHGLVEHRDVIRSARLARHFLPVDSSGACVERLTTSDDAVLLTPAHQFPLGVPLVAARRAAAVTWARDTGGVVIEDDYDGEFRYDRRPLGAMQGLAPDVVVYVGTASKSLAPGLGLGWLVAPPTLLDPLVEAKRTSDGYTGVFEQLTLDELIRSGDYDRHVRRSRLRYRQRSDILVTTLAARVPQVRVSGVAAGLHAVLDLGGALVAAHEPAITARAGEAGVLVRGMSHYRRRADPLAPAALVVGFGTPGDHAYAGALDALCTSLS
jgi:GntR family transcriptional regulator/MocR family aminotransferase